MVLYAGATIEESDSKKSWIFPHMKAHITVVAREKVFLCLRKNQPK